MLKVYRIEKMNSARGVWETVRSNRFPRKTHAYDFFLAHAVYSWMLEDSNRGLIRFLTIDWNENRIINISTWGVESNPSDSLLYQ